MTGVALAAKGKEGKKARKKMEKKVLNCKKKAGKKNRVTRVKLPVR